MISQNNNDNTIIAKFNEKHQTIINNISDLIIEIDFNGNFTYVSPQCINIFGYEPSEVIGRKALRYVHPEDLSIVMDSMRNSIENRKQISFEYRAKHKNGTYVPVSANGGAFTERENKKLLVVIKNNLDKIKADIKIKESEEKYRNLFDKSPYLILLFDLSGKIIEVNKTTLEKLVMLKKHEIIGKNFTSLDIIPPDNMKLFQNTFKDLLITGKIDPFEVEIKNPDVKLNWIKIQASIIQIGQKKYIQGIIEDIGEKKLSEEKAKESERRYRNIVENTKEAVVIINLQGKLQYVSPQLSVILKGREIKDTSRFFYYIHKEDVAKIIDFYRNTVKKKNVSDKNLEFRILSKERKYIWLSSSSKNYYDDNGDVIGFITTVKDITDKKIAEEKLKDSESRYRLIFENSNDLIRVLDDKFRIEYLNERTHLKILGYSKYDLIGQTDLKLNDVNDYKEIRRTMLKLFKKGEGVYESRMRHKEGHYLWFEETVKMFKDEEGKQKYLFISRDINDKKIAEEMLKDSETRYRLILENSNDLIRVLDDKLRVEYLNERTHMKILGYSKEEMFGKISINLNPPEDHRRICRHFLKIFKNGEGVHESRVRHIEGHYLWFEVKTKMFTDDEGNQKYLLISRDITEKKLTEVRLKESEEKYRDLFENSPSAIIVTDLRGKVLDQNIIVEKIFGIRRDDSIGRNYGNFGVFNKEQITALGNRAKQLLKGEKLKPSSLKVKNLSGEELWILHHMSIVEIGGYKLIESIVQDITERKKAEEIIKTENKRLLELNRMKNELVSRVSHELKTPLNSIYGGAQILLNLYKERTCDEALEFIEMIHKGGERLKALVENLLDISRVESGKLVLKKENANLVKIIKERTDEIKYFITQRDLTIHMDLPNETFINIDKIRIGQVITNLLSNAIKNTPSKGLISVNLKNLEDTVYLSVRDSGVGLTTEEMDKLFKKFGKIERYGQKMDVDIEGSGLGLYISKEIIDLHGGAIWVESEGKNQGSNFIIKLYK